MSLSRFELDDVGDLKILMSPREPQKYGVLQLRYSTTRYLNPASQVAIQRVV